MFTEIDFASNVIGHGSPGTTNSGTWSSLATVLSTLSNASSKKIRKGLVGSKFNVRDVKTEVDEERNRPISLILEDGNSGLSYRGDMEDVWRRPRQERATQRHTRTTYYL